MNRWKLKQWLEDARCRVRAAAEPQLWRREMGGAESLSRPRVFRITYPQLGDHWVGFCHFVRFRKFSGQPHRINLQAIYHLNIPQREQLLREMAGLLGATEQLELTDSPAELELPVHPARNGDTLLAPGVAKHPRRLIAYQFDGLSHPHLNPSPDELESFLKLFKADQLQRIGRPLTLAQSMEVLLQSRLFIGVSSGMSHLAASAATPAYIYYKGGLKDAASFQTYRHLCRWNPYPGTRFFSSLEELKALLRNKPNLVE